MTAAAVLILLSGYAVGDPPPQISATEIAARSPSLSLARNGVSAEVLVVAGASPSEIGEVVTRAAAFLREHRGSLAAAEIALSETRRALQLAEASKAAASREEVDASAVAIAQANVESAREAFEDAEEAIQTLRAQHLLHSVGGLAQTKQELVQLVLVHKPKGAPLKYLVKERTDAEWSQLCEALRIVSNSSRGFSEQQVTEAHSTVDAFNAEPEVAAAEARLQANLQLAKQQWGIAEAAALAAPN
jgi:hypothetical protein